MNVYEHLNKSPQELYNWYINIMKSDATDAEKNRAETIFMDVLTVKIQIKELEIEE